jgi:hypothetical protein
VEQELPTLPEHLSSPPGRICLGLFAVFGELRREVIVRFVAICRIVDHHCLNFLFMTIHTLQQLEIQVNV